MHRLSQAVLIVLALCIASPLPAGVLLWNSITSAPMSLALDYATAIDNFGIVVGSAGSFGNQQAAEVSISAPNAVTILSGVPANSSAAGVNNLGQVAGNYEDLNGFEHAFVWSAAIGMQLIGNLGGNLSSASAINDAGQVAGQTLTANGQPQAFFWSSSAGMLAAGNAAAYIATGINNSGQMACQEDPSPYTNIQAALCGPNSASALNLASLDPSSSYAIAINNLGWIVGDAETPSGMQGFLWTPGSLLSFGTSFLPVDLNDEGEVIGEYQGQAAAWTSAGGFQLLSGSPGSTTTLAAINDDGQIVGNTSETPEPGTLLLTASILLVPFSIWVRKGYLKPHFHRRIGAGPDAPSGHGRRADRSPESSPGSQPQCRPDWRRDRAREACPPASASRPG
jgi:probable HAF family extracellular repeat protein